MTNRIEDPFVPGQTLPASYGEDILVLLPRDPYWLFAYWEISPSTRERLHREWGDDQWQRATLLMRVYRHFWDRPGTVENYFELPLNRESDNWYIKVERSDHHYHAELGWRLPGGHFYSLLHSNMVRSPRDGLSDIIDENWQLPDWKARRLYRRIALHHLSSAELLRYRQRGEGI